MGIDELCCLSREELPERPSSFSSCPPELDVPVNTTPVLPGQPTDTDEPPEPLENGEPRRWAEFCCASAVRLSSGRIKTFSIVHSTDLTCPSWRWILRMSSLSRPRWILSSKHAPPQL